jgi:haloalkane dehalogenase
MSMSKFIDVTGHRIHYVEEGEGEPVLFVHGNPTSSLIWRNVLPSVSLALGRRGIAIDLLGFGKSDKPELEYSLPLHFQILHGFIENLKLKDIAMVLHDWGGEIGMRYAVEHPDNIRAVAAMESFLWNMRFEDFPAKFQGMFKMMRSPLGFMLLQMINMTGKMIGGAVLPTTKVPADVLRSYKEAFPTIASRQATRAFSTMLLRDGRPEGSRTLLEETEARLPTFHAPVCLIRATPGTDYSDELVDGLRKKLPQLESLGFGPGGHYLQEDDPERLSRILIEWFRSKGV